ncbi:MAG: hypothetical protein MUP90_16920 [Gammaproteobacteria bacterium]|nr:hypothetical protein [Gammaproteobacteria bacterium]
MTAEFWGYPYEQSSEPQTVIDVHEADIWPVADNSGSGTKDAIANGLHPVVAIGGRTAADGRPLNRTGVVVSFTAGLTTALGMVRVDIADGKEVYNWVANVLTYNGGNPATFETAPVVGQPVFVDDSDDLGEGVTLSMSPLNDAGVKNPLAGHLFYAQDEMANSAFGGPNATYTFDTSLANSLVQQGYCILLTSAVGELA